MKRLAFIFLVTTMSYQTMAQGDLLITPTRVLFEGNKQRETLNLVNTGKDTATYSISFLQYNMKEDGSFEIIQKPDSGQMFAEAFLRIFPRRVTLAPGEPQAIIMQFSRKTEMLAGEYRSHLYFRSEKDSKPLGMNNYVSNAAELQVQLIPIFGLSIPVIIRYGEVNMSATLSNLELETQPNGIQYFKLSIHRTGNISTYGDILIQHFPTKGKDYEVGIVKGVGVYTNINKRNVAVKLKNTSPLTSGTLKVKYVNNKENKMVIYAEGELMIGR